MDANYKHKRTINCMALSLMQRRSFLSYVLLASLAFLVSLFNLWIGARHAHDTHINNAIINTPHDLRRFGLSSTDASYPSPPAVDALSSMSTSKKTQIVPYAEPKPRPPLESIVQGWNITGDATWLLQFAIVGFPKCGTSTLMFHLQTHPEVQIFSDERCDMGFNQQAKLIQDLYTDFPAGDYVRGIKCPLDLENTQLGMKNYNQFFPRTDFIVGIRHPVLWCVS